MLERHILKAFVLVLMLATVHVSAQPSRSFSLEETADTFPSRGFEDRIAFWTDVFSRYDLNEVLFHDAVDLKLVYGVDRVGDSPRMTAAQEERQRDRIRDRREAWQQEFDGILRLGADSPELNERQRRIVQALRSAGYATTPDELRERRERLRAQRGIRSKFRDGLVRAGRYLEYIEDTFRREGLPVELAALPHIESSFDYNAYSRAGAAGIWQFTSSTGRSYMRINSVVDERLDPLRATEAAAAVLKDNYRSLGSWPLALTAYNYGKYGMLRARSRFGDDLLEIIRHHQTRTFGFASKNFYAEFLAALYVSRNAVEYFGRLEVEPAMRYDTIRISRSVDPTHLTAGGRLQLAEVAALNPHLRTLRGSSPRPVPEGAMLRVPEGLGPQLEASMRSAPAVAAGTSLAADGSLHYKVERGDTLGGIASRYGVSVSHLKSANGLRDANTIYPGQTLLVNGASRPQSRAAGESPTRYRVERGDTLTAIADRFDTTPAVLEQANRLSDPDSLGVGQTLSIPADAPAATTHYRIRRGDTLARIAARFNTSIQDLQRLNSIPNVHRIQPGQRLLVPLPSGR